MLRKLFTSLKFEWEILSVSLFISACILLTYFQLTNFDLEIPKHLYISQASSDGIDAGKRIQFYYTSILILLGVLGLAYTFLFQLFGFCKAPKSWKQFVGFIALSGCLLIIADSMGAKSLGSIRLVSAILTLNIILLFLSRWKSSLRYFNQHQFITAHIMYALLVTVVFVFGSGLNVEFHTAFIIFASALAFFMISMKQIFQLSVLQVIQGLLPLVLVPLLLFISTETYFFCESKFGIELPYRVLFIILLSLSFIIHIVKQKFSPTQLSLQKLVSNYIAPSVIICFVLISFYHPILQQSEELFEMANPANAQLRVWRFHEFPVLDFMSSHMLSEQFYGYLYHSIFPLKAMPDFLVYEFMYILLFYILAYSFCLRILKNAGIAVLLLCAFPFIENLFAIHLFFAVLALYACNRIVEKQSTKNYVALASTLMLLMLWRLDTGAAAILTSSVYLPIQFILKKEKVHWRTLLKSVLLYCVSLLLLLLLIFIFYSPSILLKNMQLALHYMSGNQAHAYSSLANSFDQHVYFFYALIPLLSLFGIFVNIFYATKYKALTFTHKASMFFFLIVLANFQRGLVRHNFMEGNDSFLVSTFYLATTLCIIACVNYRSNAMKYVTFSVSAFLLVITLSYFPLAAGNTSLENALLTSPSLHLKENIIHPHRKGRTIENESFVKNNYQDLKLFIDKHLSATQTFLDFSNTPMLYYYCQRKVPSYFCQNQQNAIDGFIQHTDIKKFKVKDIPVVVYSHSPPNWFDATDNIPNSLRQYYYAEYIYQNYRPFVILSGKSIWIDKTLDWSLYNLQSDSSSQTISTHNYKKMAMYINRYYAHQADSLLQVVSDYTVSDTSKIYIPHLLQGASNIFARIHIPKPEQGKTITLTLMSNALPCANYTFNTSQSDTDYMIRLSNHYFWYNKSNLYLKTSDIGIKKIQFLSEQ